jgi:hypothetical protein
MATAWPAAQRPSRLWRPLQTGLDSVGAGEPRSLIPSQKIDKPAPPERLVGAGLPVFMIGCADIGSRVQTN